MCIYIYIYIYIYTSSSLTASMRKKMLDFYGCSHFCHTCTEHQYLRHFIGMVLVRGHNKDPPILLGPHFYRYFWRRVLVGSEYS